MATKKSQQIGIWIIAIVMTVGTLGSFAVMILQNDNKGTDKARLAQLTAEYKVQTDAYQAKVDAQATELSSKYFIEFNQYINTPAVFDKAGVTELKTEDLKVGDGADISATSSFSAYYLGWGPDGKVFDGSVDSGKLKAPFAVTPGGVIPGWTEGVVGMKTGGIRVLTIPSAKAYGEAGSGTTIPANTPLKFVIIIIPTPEVIPQPQPSAELLKLYQAK